MQPLPVPTSRRAPEGMGRIGGGAGWSRANRLDGPVDEFLGLGPGDEYVLIYIESQPGKPAFVEDVLYRPVGEQFASIDIILSEDGVGEGLRRFRQAVYLSSAGQVFHYPIGDQRGFAAAVEGCQVGGQLSLCLPVIHSAKLDQFA